MKKIISLILCVLMLAASLSLGVSALPLSSSRDELNALFLDGMIDEMDNVYYSPVRKNDSIKYPLMIWLHGNASGDEPRRQIKYRGFSNWASDEFQARFRNAGGCFLFAPRSNSVGNTWSLIATATLKKNIDGFIAQYKDNIDLSRIYIGGYSVGADMTWKMLLAYPSFFAAGLPCSAISPPTPVEVATLKNTSVWTFNCDIDFWQGAKTGAIKPVFDALVLSTSRKDGIRMTSVTEVVLADGTKQGSYQEEHYTWEMVTYDMHMADHITPYKYSTTVDGTGAVITFENPEIGVIDWLSQQTNEEGGEDIPEVSGIAQLIRRIVNFFKQLFSVFWG